MFGNGLITRVTGQGVPADISCLGAQNPRSSLVLGTAPHPFPLQLITSVIDEKPEGLVVSYQN